MMTNILEGFRITKTFSTGSIFSFFNSKREKIVALDNINIEIEKGKTLVVAGESGSGKTTLAKILLRALNVDEGQIFFEGHEITHIKGKDLRRYRSDVHYVHQDPYSSLNPRMRIHDILMEPLEIHQKELSKDKKNDMILSVLEKVKLTPVEQISKKFPHSLSGGQRQRVALARALINEPKVIITDEPVSMLDVSIRLEILNLINNFKQSGISFMYITHDLATSRIVGDNIIIMYSGSIVEKGPIDAILFNPLHPYTKALINSISEPDPTNLIREKDFEVLEKKEENKGCKFHNTCNSDMEKCLESSNMIEIEDRHFVSCRAYEGQ